jgi:hypothetical protein
MEPGRSRRPGRVTGRLTGSLADDSQNGPVDRRAKIARPWTIAVFTIVVLAAIAGLVSVAWLGQQHDNGGQRGTVDVTGCAFASYATHGDIYKCGGNFTADDHSFTIPYVTFTNDGRLDTGHRVPVIVAGPEATTGIEVAESRARLIITLGGALMLAVVLAVIWRLWLKARAATR